MTTMNLLTSAVSLTASEAAAAIRSGAITAESYVSALIEEAKRASALNILVSQNDSALLAAAHQLDRERKAGRELGEFAGIPLLVKDNIETLALPTTAGTPGLARNKPEANAPLLERMFEADALLFGKTNMHELSMGVTSGNLQYGSVHNPYDHDRIPGGSSGGTAAGLAARVSPAGFGTDTVGSSRIPASLCGVVGFRPSSGRYPSGGTVPASHTRDEIAPMARSVRDIELIDRIITKRSATQIASLAGIRLGVPRAYFWSNLAPDVEATLKETRNRLEEAGCILIEVELPGLPEMLNQVGPILAFEAVDDMRAYLALSGTGLTFEALLESVKGPDVARFYQRFLDTGLEPCTYLEALQVHRPRLRALFADMFRDSAVAALFVPATPITAPAIGQDQLMLNGVQTEVIVALAQNAHPASAAGLPALALPAGLTSSGLPVGLELLGPADQDIRLLSLGLAVESELPLLPPPEFRPVPRRNA